MGEGVVDGINVPQNGCPVGEILVCSSVSVFLSQVWEQKACSKDLKLKTENIVRIIGDTFQDQIVGLD